MNDEVACSERKRNRRQQVRQADVAVHFTTDTISYSVDNLGAILRWIDMHTEWALTERHVYHVNDGFGDIGHIGVSRCGSSKPLHDVVAKMRVRAVVVLGLTRFVRRRARVCK